MSKICILLPAHWGAARGGAEYQSHLLAEHISLTTQHEVVYVARHVPENPAVWAYPIERFGGPTLWGGAKWGMWLDSFSLYRTLKRLQPDVIIHMVAGAYTGVASFYASRHGALHFWYLASDKDIDPVPNVGVSSPARHIDTLLFRYGALHADFIVAQTEAQAERMKGTLRREATIVIPNFLVGPQIESPKPDQFTVAWVANLKHLKRPELFVEVANRIGRRLPIRWVMAGRSDQSSGVTALLAQLKEQDLIEYRGELTVQEVEEQLESAHLLVNTSDFEGLPNTFVQSWLRSVPVLSLNVDPDGVMEKFGLGTRCGSLDRLQTRIEELYANRAELNAMASRARAFALENHSMRNADRLLELIDRKLTSVQS